MLCLNEADQRKQRVLSGVYPSQNSLHLFYSLVWGPWRLTSGSRCLPENLPTISKSADLSEKVPNPLNSYGVPFMLYVLSDTGIQSELSEISKSADLSRKVPNPLNQYGIPFTLYVLYRHRDPIKTFRERSADFEIGGRFSGRPLSSEVSLSPPHTRL